MPHACGKLNAGRRVEIVGFGTKQIKFVKKKHFAECWGIARIF